MASPFLDYVREFMVSRRYAKRTVETYLYWIRFYILFRYKQHPNQLSDEDVENFLSYLSNQRTLAVKTQATALIEPKYKLLTQLIYGSSLYPSYLKPSFVDVKFSPQSPSRLCSWERIHLWPHCNINYLGSQDNKTTA